MTDSKLEMCKNCTHWTPKVKIGSCSEYPGYIHGNDEGCDYFIYHKPDSTKNKQLSTEELVNWMIEFFGKWINRRKPWVRRRNF